MDGESENREANQTGEFAVVGESALSFGYFSLGAIKEK
jgi:hypothetical protein